MPNIPASHKDYSHLKPNGDFNLDRINHNAVEATRDWMNYQLRHKALPASQRRAYLPTLDANLKREWRRAHDQREMFVMHRQIARGAFQGVFA
jgi:hypothetical protein